jgi:hypothetical protein
MGGRRHPRAHNVQDAAAVDKFCMPRPDHVRVSRGALSARKTKAPGGKLDLGGFLDRLEYFLTRIVEWREPRRKAVMS